MAKDAKADNNIFYYDYEISFSVVIACCSSRKLLLLSACTIFLQCDAWLSYLVHPSYYNIL